MSLNLMSSNGKIPKCHLNAEVLLEPCGLKTKMVKSLSLKTLPVVTRTMNHHSRHEFFGLFLLIYTTL